MAFLGPIAEALLPMASSVLGPVIGNLLGGHGGKRRMDDGDGIKKRRRRGRGLTPMIGGKMCGGRRLNRKKYKRLNGKGIGDVFKKIFHYGKIAYNVAKDKRVRGLVKHGVKTYKNIRDELRAKKENQNKTEEQGAGMRMKRKMKQRWAKRIRIKGRGMGDNTAATVGPLP